MRKAKDVKENWRAGEEWERMMAGLCKVRGSGWGKK